MSMLIHREMANERTVYYGNVLRKFGAFFHIVYIRQLIQHIKCFGEHPNLLLFINFKSLSSLSPNLI